LPRQPRRERSKAWRYAALDERRAQLDAICPRELRRHEPVDAFDADFNDWIGHGGLRFPSP